MSTSRIHPAPILAVLLLATGCWRLGEPTSSEAVVSWAAFPDTVTAGAPFAFEFAGPITPNSCGRLDTAIATVTDTSIELRGRRTTFDTSCSRLPISFYEVRSLELPAGAYAVRTPTGELGRIVSLEGGPFSSMRAVGTGTVRDVGACTLFGPGQLGGNQRPFALIGRALANADLQPAFEGRRLVYVRGTLSGFTLCGSFGSRPAIRVSEIRVLERTVNDYYEK